MFLRILTRPVWCILVGLFASLVHAQVSTYSFALSSGPWQPIAGNGIPLGLVGLPPPFTIDDNAFVTEGEDIPLGDATTGNGWPIGFDFTFNGQVFDRVGLSTEGWLSLGQSVRGINAVYVPIGPEAYTPLSSPLPTAMDPVLRYRIVGFANDMAPGGGISSWPIQIRTAGIAPNRTFIAEFNGQRSGGGGTYAYQIRLAEGAGMPAAQTVRVVFGTMTPVGDVTGQVGLGGSDPSDFNNRSVTATPYDWAISEEGTTNDAMCRVPSTATNLPQGLTFTWSPPACAVYDIVVEDFIFQLDELNATLSWAPTAGATAYDYVITAGGPDDTPVASGNGLTTTTVLLNDLPIGQLFAYVRATCAAQTPNWSAPHPFNTAVFSSVVCGQAPQEDTYCYTNFEQRSWTYISTTGDPLRLILQAGVMSAGDVLTMYDGPDDQAPQLFTSIVTPFLPGQVVNSSGGSLTMRITADGVGSCENLEWVDPLEWEVGCVDCDPVLASFSVEQDCENEQFFVQVVIFNMGSATTVSITNDGSAPVVTANAPGQFTSGPFAIGTPVIVTAANTLNAYCSAISTEQLNSPCPFVSCGPDNYTYCYVDADAGQWVYRSEGSERIGIRFISGTLAANDAVRVYDGEDVFGTVLHGSTGAVDLAGLFVVSSATSTTILLEVAADEASSCGTGQALPWNYVISCYEGCLPPVATYTVVEDCDNEQFSIDVVLSAMGSSSSLQITNDGGVSAITVTATGAFAVGPFSNGTLVTVSIDGDEVLCSTNSSALTFDCGVGIEELIEEKLMIYPNPGQGMFRLLLPSGFGGSMLLDVLDLSGRRVAGMALQGNSDQGSLVDLGYLSVGSYVLVLHNGEQVGKGLLNVVR